MPPASPVLFSYVYVSPLHTRSVPVVAVLRTLSLPGVIPLKVSLTNYAYVQRPYRTHSETIVECFCFKAALAPPARHVST
jgi:hypothetical protein